VIGIFGNIEGESEEANDEAFIGFRGVSGDGQAVIGIEVIVEVRDLELGFVDDCFEGHKVG